MNVVANEPRNRTSIASQSSNQKIAEKEANEMAAFKAFAAVRPLPLALATATNQSPPCPDILCDLEDGNPLAFELVECEDVTSVGTQPGKLIAVSAIDSKDIDLRLALQTAYYAAVDANRLTQPERFEYHTIEVDFVDGASTISCQNAIPDVINVLIERGPGIYVIDKKSIRVIRCTRWDMTPSSYKGPMFDCNVAGIHVGLSVVERIKTKVLTKKYTSSAPIHLLAWSHGISAEEMKLGEEQKLADFIKSAGLGPFVRVWVFGRDKNEIAFDSAAYVSQAGP